MDQLDSAAVLGLALIALLPLAAALFGESRPASTTPIYLYRMLRQQGDAVATLAVSAGGREFRVAVSQCAGCAARAQCAAWLESGRCDGYEKFCGNAEYVARMRALAKAY